MLPIFVSTIHRAHLLHGNCNVTASVFSIDQFCGKYQCMTEHWCWCNEQGNVVDSLLFIRVPDELTRM